MAEILPDPNPETTTKICSFIRSGATYDIAAVAAGISPEVAQAWQARAETAKSGLYFEFAEDILRAVAQFEVVQIQRINAEGGAAGARWLLEKTLPKKYGKQAVEKPPRGKGKPKPRLGEITEAGFSLIGEPKKGAGR